MADDDVEAACAALAREVEELVIEFVTEVVAILVETTPFETGHARRNWIPRIGGPFRGVEGSIQTGKRKGRYTTAKGDRQASGLREVLAYKLDQGDVYITNNVGYVRVLNYGTSSQAPANFIEAAIEQALNNVMGGSP